MKQEAVHLTNIRRIRAMTIEMGIEIKISFHPSSNPLTFFPCPLAAGAIASLITLDVGRHRVFAAKFNDFYTQGGIIDLNRFCIVSVLYRGTALYYAVWLTLE